MSTKPCAGLGTGVSGEFKAGRMCHLDQGSQDGLSVIRVLPLGLPGLPFIMNPRNAEISDLWRFAKTFVYMCVWFVFCGEEFHQLAREGLVFHVNPG